MAWNEPGGNKHDPWGGGNRGNGGGGPPDLDEAWKRLQEKMSRLFGGSGGGPSSRGGFGIGKGAVVIVLIVLALGYGLWGVHFINEQERGVVLRLGVYNRTLGPGFNWVPPIVEIMYPVNVTFVREHPTRGPMLTQDLNIVEVNLSVQYSIGNAEDFVLKVRDPENSLEEATDSALRHVIGSTEMHEVLTEGRGQIAIDVKKRLQEYLNYYQTGIRVEKVNVEATTPPLELKGAFDDVNRAREDEERVKNEAHAYANKIIPEARGAAQRVIEEANGYREKVVAEAQGEALRFEKLLAEYKKAPEVTRQRLYLDAVQQVMANSSKVMVDVQGGNNMMYLPLDRLVQQGSSSNISTQKDLEKMMSDFESRMSSVIRRELQNSRSRDGGR